ncbi:MAG TPA: hypothetical protein VKT76_12435 [Bradyrhizobium sp.]|nr:hypothetical protein [Bradyrhizobium sp.]
MKFARYIGPIALVVAFGVSAAYAQSLKMKQRESSEAEDLVKDAKSLNEACGTEIAVKFDWTEAKEDLITANSPESYCDGMLSGVRRVCGSPDGKAAVKGKVKTISCGFGPERKMSLKDGTIDYKIDFKSANDADFSYEFLQNNL